MDSRDYQTRTLDIPKKLYEQVKEKANLIGLSFDEYVNSLLEKGNLDFESRKQHPVTKGKYFFAKDEEEIRKGL